MIGKRKATMPPSHSHFSIGDLDSPLPESLNDELCDPCHLGIVPQRLDVCNWGVCSPAAFVVFGVESGRCRDR